MTQLADDLRPPIRVVAPKVARTLPDPATASRYAFETKFDGARAAAVVERGHAQLQSRHLRPLGRFFPEILPALVEQLPDGTVVDGELVVYHGGRLDFAALQRRFHPSPTRVAQLARDTPATLVVFDVLATLGTDVRPWPYLQRRQLLEQLLADPAPPLALMPMTRDLAGAHAWLTRHSGDGIEGVVMKNVTHGYLPGSNRFAWEKVRARLTAAAVVGGVLGSLHSPAALILGRPDANGLLRVAGRTRPLTRAGRTEIAPALTPLAGSHPWPATLSSSRFGRLPPRPVAYVRVEPLVVVELDTDVCFEHGRWRHPTIYRRIRSESEQGVPEQLDDLGWTQLRGRP